MDRGGDLLWTWHGVGRRNRQNIPQGMEGICCNQSDRGASQPATDASPPAGTPQGPSDASLVEHCDRGLFSLGLPETMRSRAERAFDNMCANKINVAIIIIVVQHPAEALPVATEREIEASRYARRYQRTYQTIYASRYPGR